MLFRLAVHIALGALLLAIPAQSRAVDPPNPVNFDRDVKPIFAKHCISCHGPDKQKSGLRLDQRAGALAGGDGGVVIVPEKSAVSRLIKLVSEDSDVRMPPKGARLTAAEIATLRAWIDQGAKWPDDGSGSQNA